MWLPLFDVVVLLLEGLCVLQVEIRAFLERARPIDKRLRYQMDKLLAAAAAVQVPLLLYSRPALCFVRLSCSAVLHSVKAAMACGALCTT